MLPRRRTSDAVWRSQVKNASRGTAHAIEFGWDVRKCFEKVERGKLCRLAVDLGYPAPLLRVSVASYRWPRRLQFAGMVSRAIVAVSGIVAGGGYALWELLAYMFVAATRVTTSCPSADLSIFVDDLTVAVTAPTMEQVVELAALVGAHLRVEFEIELHMVFEDGKAYLIATSSCLLYTSDAADE